MKKVKNTLAKHAAINEVLGTSKALLHAKNTKAGTLNAWADLEKFLGGPAI